MRSFRRSFSLVALFVIGSAILCAPRPVAADDLPYFAADKLERFDGKSWAGLTLDHTTQDGVKHQFRNSRGDFSTSVLLEQEGGKDLPYRVSALYVNKDKDATLQGICIKYKSDADGIPLEKLQAALGGAGEVRYPARRFEEWKMVAFPDRGVIAFVLHDKAPLILLGVPSRIAAALSVLPAEGDPPPIENYTDLFRNRERILRFGDTDVSFSLKGIPLYDQSREERDIRRETKNASEGGYLRYDPTVTNGTYRISVTAKYSADKGGDGSVEASLSGQGPFGYLSSTQTESFKIDKGASDRKLDDTRYSRALADAMQEVERDMARKVRTQQPPPVETVRLADWNRVLDKYRFHSAAPTGAAPDTPSSGNGALVD